jgi:hypothetical protein
VLFGHRFGIVDAPDSHDEAEAVASGADRNSAAASAKPKTSTRSGRNTDTKRIH